MQVTRYNVSIETDGSGDFTTTITPPSGFFLQARYVVDATNPLATGADLTIAETHTGFNLLTQADIGVSSYDILPRSFVADAGDGTELLEIDKIAVGDEVTVTIAQGGADNVGTLHLYFGYDG